MQLPPDLDALVGPAEWQPVREGESGAAVYRLVAGAVVRYLKVTPPEAGQAEAERLRWLRGRVPVPEVLYAAPDQEQHYLLLSAIPGLMPFHDDLDWPPNERITFMAGALRRFHALAGCPFRFSYDDQIAAARQSVERGTVREDLFDSEFRGRSPADMLAELVALRPAGEPEWVVGHGDLYPVNVLADPASGVLTGYLDVGRTALMDRYTDLALVANAIRWHFGEDWLLPFFRQYGIDQPDLNRLRFFRLLDALA